MRKLEFVSVENFPKEINANCLSFALGITESFGFSDAKLLDDTNPQPIGKSFISKVNSLGFDTSGFRQISSESEAEFGKDYIFKIYGFFEFLNECFGTYWVDDGDYHICRRELDGSWVHKFGWDEPPCKINDWWEINNEYGDKYVLFAYRS